MKYFGIAAAALVMTMAASASTVLVPCSGNTATGFSSPGAGTGSITCSAFSSLPPLSTFVSESVIIQTDYSGGNLGASNAIQTVYTSAVAGFTTDTLTASGVGGSSTYTDSASLSVYPATGATYYIDPTTLGYPSGGFTVNWASTITSGGVQAITGQVYELITYTSAVPEPGSMALLGGGLLALSLVSRKRFARK